MSYKGKRSSAALCSTAEKQAPDSPEENSRRQHCAPRQVSAMWFKNAQCIHCWSQFFDLHLTSGSASNRFSRHSQNSSWSKAVNFKTAEVHRSPLKSSMLRRLQKISSCRYFWKAFGSSKWFLGTWYSSRTCDHYLSGQVVFLSSCFLHTKGQITKAFQNLSSSK